MVSPTADLIIERRQTRRRLAFWRIVAIVAVVIAIIAMIPPSTFTTTRDHLARIRIDGVIVEDRLRDAALQDLAEADHVKAVIVRINSPGGTVAASEALYEGLRRIAESKPVVAVMSEAAASGGYIAAIATDHIVARGSTLTGSIGVIAQMPNFAGLMEKIGVDVTRVKSAPLKAEPNFTSRPDEAVLAAQKELIDDSFGWFKGLVETRRGISGATLDAVSDGRVFTGRQALENGLVDAIGGEEVARAWLESSHGLAADMNVVDYDWAESPLPWPFSSAKESLAGLLRGPELMPAGPRLYAVIQ